MMMERKKLWELPVNNRLEIIIFALASSLDIPLVHKLKGVVTDLISLDYLNFENTYSRSIQARMDKLFQNSISTFMQADNRCGLRQLWCGRECANCPENHIWALATHPCASEALINHACSCARSLGR